MQEREGEEGTSAGHQVLHDCWVCTISTKLQTLNLKLRPWIQAVKKFKPCHGGLWDTLCCSPPELQSPSLLRTFVLPHCQAMSPCWLPLHQPRSFCLSPSGEEDRDCQQGRKHWLSAAPLLVTAEVTWMSNSGSLTLQKMEGRPLTAEISYESPPYWLASCQLVNVDCLHKSKPFVFLLWNSLHFQAWERICQAEQYKLRH